MKIISEKILLSFHDYYSILKDSTVVDPIVVQLEVQLLSDMNLVLDRAAFEMIMRSVSYLF